MFLKAKYGLFDNDNIVNDTSILDEDQWDAKIMEGHDLKLWDDKANGVEVQFIAKGFYFWYEGDVNPIDMLEDDVIVT